MCLWGVFFLLSSITLLQNVDERLLRPNKSDFVLLCFVFFFFLQVWQYLIPTFKNTSGLDCLNTGCCPRMTLYLASPEERRCVRRQGRNVSFGESCKRTKLFCLLCLLSKNHRMESYWRGEKTKVQRWCSGSVGSKCTLAFTSVALIYIQGGG